MLLTCPFQEKVLVEGTSANAKLGKGRLDSGGAVEGKAVLSGWCVQLPSDNELAQEWGSSLWVLANFHFAWHCSMQERRIKLLAATEMESLKHHGCWALEGKCFLSY